MQVTQWIYKHQSVNTYLENIKNYKFKKFKKNKKRSNTEIVKRLKQILKKKEANKLTENVRSLNITRVSSCACGFLVLFSYAILFLVVLGLLCFARAFSSCGKQGYSPLQGVGASLCGGSRACGFSSCRLSSCGPAFWSTGSVAVLPRLSC